MKEGTFNRGLLNQVPVAFGTLIYLICGIAVSVVASKSLSADDYVNYSAFVSVGGIFVLGVGAAIEQETNLVYFRLNGNSGATWRYMIPRVIFAVLVLWILFLSPFFSWQSHLFGNSSTEVQLSIAFGAPGLLLAGVMKGIVNGRAEFRRLALSHIISFQSTPTIAGGRCRRLLGRSRGLSKFQSTPTIAGGRCLGGRLR